MSLYNDLTTVLTPYANKIKQNESDIGDIQDALVNVSADVFVNTNATDVDLDIVDSNGNVLVRFANGHIKMKNFDSSQISEEIEEVLSGKWTGKKWTCVGDSLTEVNQRTTMHYHDYIAEKTGITVVNKGVSGTGYMSGVNDNRSFIARVATVPTDSDVVTIFGSCNDRMLTLGEITDTGTSTVCGCINKTLDDLFARMPTCNLGVITPTPIKGNGPSNDNSTMSKYSAALVEICRKRSIPCLDLFHCSGLRPDDPTAEAATYSKDNGNGVHPDEAGHAIIAPKIEAFLESLIM